MFLSFSSLVAIMFGPYVHQLLGDELVQRGFGRILLITDKGIEKTGHVESLLSILKERGIEVLVFDEVRPNPTLFSVEEALEAALVFEPQALVALGGGSVLDTAKGMGIWYTNQKQRLWDLIDPSKREYPMLPVITIPTTAGTGSEVSSWAVITHDQWPEKMSIGGEKMSPTLALVDPFLTVTLPLHLTLYTGLDAFTHALEAYLALGSTPFIKEIATIAAQRIMASLPVVLKDGGDLDARGEVMLGSLLAGWAMENAGLGLVHGMSHQVSAFYDYQHGLTNAILLPYVLDFNANSCVEEFSYLDRALGGEGDLVQRVNDLYEEIGFSQKLTIRREDLLDLVNQALKNVNTKANPKEIDGETMMTIFQEAFLVEG